MYSPTLEQFHNKRVLSLKSNIILKTVRNKLLSDFDQSFKLIKDTQPKLDRSLFGQIFLQRIDLSEGVNYEIPFNISKAQRFISEEKIGARQIPVNYPLLYSDRDKLEYHKVQHYFHSMNKIDPVITVFYHSINRHLVIDGNHRLEVAKRRKLETIPAFSLSEYGLFELLNDDLSRYLYIYHHNLTVLTKLLFFKGLMPLKRKKSFGKFDYYPME